jgi:hypothetical protein
MRRRHGLRRSLLSIGLASGAIQFNRSTDTIGF